MEATDGGYEFLVGAGFVEEAVHALGDDFVNVILPDQKCLSPDRVGSNQIPNGREKPFCLMTEI